MPELFEPVTINLMNLKNRIVRSATCEGLADKDGKVTKRLSYMMAELARNEVGLIITGYAFVTPDGQSSPNQMAVHDDSLLPGLKMMTREVHDAGGKIVLQIAHAGKFSKPQLTGRTPMGPTVEEADGKAVCLSMSKKDIAAITNAFVHAALRAKLAGFDAVQIHGAHGYLLSQFLSPAFNKRIDEYGGELENRARFLLDVVKGIRASVGTDYPVLVKINSDDFMDQGMTCDEAIALAKILEEASVDAIELSGGTLASPKLKPVRLGSLRTRDEEVYYREAALHYKKQVKIPLMLVGGIRSREVAEELITDGVTDFVSLSRPLIAKVDLVKRWHVGDYREANCLSCNKCINRAAADEGLYCSVKGLK